MALLVEAARVTATTVDILKTTTDLLANVKDMATMREKGVKTVCKEYLTCKFLLLANGEKYKPLCTHLENRHTKQRKAYPTTVEEMKTLMVDCKAPGGTAPTTAKKNKDNQEVAFAES